MDYVDLVILDFTKISTPEGRAELSVLARDAMHKDGFLYVINHGLSPTDVSVMRFLPSKLYLTTKMGCRRLVSSISRMYHSLKFPRKKNLTIQAISSKRELIRDTNLGATG